MWKKKNKLFKTETGGSVWYGMEHPEVKRPVMPAAPMRTAGCWLFDRCKSPDNTGYYEPVFPVNRRLSLL